MQYHLFIISAVKMPRGRRRRRRVIRNSLNELQLESSDSDVDPAEWYEVERIRDLRMENGQVSTILAQKIFI